MTGTTYLVKRFHFLLRCCFVVTRTLFDLNIKDVSQCVMPGVKKSNDVELQLHESDATDQTEVSSVTNSFLRLVTVTPVHA